MQKKLAEFNIYKPHRKRAQTAGYLKWLWQEGLTEVNR